MLAHSDETDDSNGSAGIHPGCAVIPAALAMAERENASGEAFVRAVILGYDIGSRTTKALGRDAMREKTTCPSASAAPWAPPRRRARSLASAKSSSGICSPAAPSRLPE